MRRWVALLSAAVVMSGCDSDDPAEQPPLPKVTHEKAAVPKDRDREAVLAAIRRLDPCALLEPGDLPLGGVPAAIEPEARALYDCNLLVEDADGVYLEMEDLDTKRRQTLLEDPVGDARAYREIQSDFCAYHLPVSFGQAIKVAALLEGTDPCVPAKAFAEQVVTRLSGDLAEYESEPRWDACSVLAGILDEDPAGFRSDVTFDGLSSCEEGNGDATFALDYNDERLEQSDTIAGVPVDIHEDTNCMIRWQHSDKAPRYADRAHTYAMVTAPDCTAATSVAEKAIQFLRTPPPVDNPQRPVLYKPDEPDVPFAGACRYFPVPACQPYVEVPVPSGTSEILRQAEADANVECAASIDAIRKHFDKELEAVTSEQRGCDYFAAGGRYTVKVAIDNLSLDVNDDGERTKIGDHPAAVKQVDGYTDLSVAVTSDPQADGLLFIAVMSRHGHGESPDKNALDPDTLKAVAAEILDKHFR